MLQDIRKIWLIFSAEERRKAFWILLLMVLMALTEAAGVLSIMPFLSVLSRPDIVSENAMFLSFSNLTGMYEKREIIFALGLAAIVIVVTASLFKTVALHILNRFVHMQRHAISSRLLARYLCQPYEFFLGRNSSELSKNILSEVDQLLFNLIQPFSQLLAHSTVVLVMTVLIFCYDPVMALWILAVVGLLYGAIYVLVRKRLKRIGLEQQIANRERYQSCLEALGGIKDVQITHSADIYLERFSKMSRLYSRHLAASDTLSQSPLYFVEAVGFTGLIAISLILMHRTDDIAQVLPALGLYGFAGYRLLPAAQIVYRGFAKLKFSSAALSLISHDLGLVQEKLDSATEDIIPLKEIRLTNIRYAYPSTMDAPVFDGFNLVIPANTSVGISGKSGAGKSTLMDILLGLLQPQKGSLSVDSVTIDARNIRSWQNSIGYVPQHIYLADTSVAENIAFGVPKCDIDIQSVQRAAMAAQIHEFVMHDLPAAYNTIVGERGVRLSGGQRQRIGVARALYRDPPVLLFDEATSALDAQTEAAVNDAIRVLAGGKTIIVIAHKESALASCDSIVTITS